MNRIETVNIGQKIVIGQNEKIIAVFTIPADDLIRRGVAVAVDRMRVRVAFIPVEFFSGNTNTLFYNEVIECESRVEIE